MKKPIINSNHYLALAVSGLIFTCSIVAYLFVYNQVAVQIADTANAYGQVSQDQLEQNGTTQVAQILSQTQSERNLLQSFFVSDTQTVGFITQVEGIGKEAGNATVTIASISDDDLSDAPIGTAGNIHAHIDIQGTWPEAMHAFHLLESLPYGESIDNVRVAPASAKEWSVEFDLTTVLIHE